MTDNKVVVQNLLEKFVLLHKTEWAICYDVGCVGSSYTDFVKQNCDELHGIDIREHDEAHAPLCKHHQLDFRGVTKLEPRPHTLICVNTFSQMSMQVEQGHREMINLFQRMYRLVLDGLFLTIPFSLKGRTAEKLYLTPAILRQMLIDIPIEYRSTKFFLAGNQISFQEATTTTDTSLCILTIDKLGGIRV